MFCSDTELFDALISNESASWGAGLSMKDIVHQGTLMKLDKAKISSTEQWVPRHIVLKRGYIYRFHSQRDTKGKPQSLEGAIVTDASQQKQRAFTLCLSVPDGASRNYLFLSAASREEYAAWMNAFKACIP